MPNGPPIEIPGRRTELSKEFDLGGGRRRTIHHSKAQHFWDGVRFEEIDLTPLDRGNRWQVEGVPYLLQIFKSDARMLYQSGGTGTWEMTIDDLGGPLTVVPTIVTSPEVEIRFNDIRPGLDLIYEVRPNKVRTIKVLKDATAPTTFVFTVEETEVSTFIEHAQLYGWDSKYPGFPLRRPAEFTRVTGPETPVPPDKKSYSLTETFTGQALELTNLGTREGTLMTDIVYPVTMYG